METYDVIMLGLGGMGTAAVYELARRGHRVLGIEQFRIAHDRGSSHGLTRIIRKAYFEDPGYVPLLQRAYERWYDLEQCRGERLLVECGVLCMGPADCEVIGGVRTAAAKHRLTIENYDTVTLAERFADFCVPDAWEGVFEPSAGLLFVERCVAAYAEAARCMGAELHEQEECIAWCADDRHVEVVTNQNRYGAAKLVITAGAWATRLLTDAGVPFSVMRQVAMWFGTSAAERFRRDRFPCFFFDTPGGFFYGFPMLDQRGVKLARHYGAAELSDPSQVDWEAKTDDEATLRRFLIEHIPGVDGARTQASVCMYTLTPDRHFVIDLHPRHPNVAVAAGFSGHGFKFASVVGELLADLCERGATALPIEMFRAGRFGEAISGGEGA
jgi:sarcosine oxidase